MFRLIKQVLIVLLSFSRYLVTKYMSLSNETCIARSALSDLNPFDFNCYSCMISLDRCNWSCNTADDLSTKKCLSSETKDVNVKVFNMITRIKKAKKMVKHLSCDYKCKFNSTTCNSNQKWNDYKWQCEFKNCRTCQKDCSWNRNKDICETGKYLKSIIDSSVILCDEILNTTDSVSTNVTKTISTSMLDTISTNVASTVSINSGDKKVRYKIDCYILHTVLLLIILIFIIAIISYRYAKYRSKQKRIGTLIK